MRHLISRTPPALLYAASIAGERSWALLTIPLMAAFLSPEEYGRYDVALSLVDVLTVVFGLGLSDTVIRYASGCNQNTRQEALASLLGSGLIVAVILGVIAQLLLPWAMSALQIRLPEPALRLSIIAVSFICAVEVPLVWLRMIDRATDFFKFVMVRSAAFACATSFALLMGWGAAGVLTCNAVVSLATTLMIVSRQMRETGLSISAESLRRLAIFGLPVVGASMCIVMLGTGSRWFLPGYVSDAEIAHLGLATRLSLITFLALAPFSLWWHPRRLDVLMGTDGAERSAQIWGFGLAILVLSGLGVALMGPVLVTSLFPSGYAEAARYVAPMVLIQVLLHASWLSNAGAYSHHNGMKALAVDAAGAAVALMLYPILIAKWGVPGAIGAMACGHVTRLFLFLWVGRASAPIPYPFRSAAVLIAFSASAIAVAPAPAFILERTYWNILAWIAALVVAVSLRLVWFPASLQRFTRDVFAFGRR